MRMGTRIYLRKRPVGRRETPGLLPGNDILLYTPARISGTGRAKWERLPWHPYLEFAAQNQKVDAQDRREALMQRRSLVRVGARGHPRIYQDQEILEYLGLDRSGGQLHECRTMPAETRARRRYPLLAPEFRALLTEDEFVEVEINVVRQRKRHNALRLAWNAARCRTDLINEILKQKDMTDGDSRDQNHN